jgi:cell wall assembly regulator SMI1
MALRIQRLSCGSAISCRYIKANAWATFLKSITYEKSSEMWLDDDGNDET